MRLCPKFVALVVLMLIAHTAGTSMVVQAQSAGAIAGTVTDETGAALPGVAIELRGLTPGAPEPAGSAATPHLATSDQQGLYRFDPIPAGRYVISFALINFAGVRRDVEVGLSPVRADAVLHLALNADVTVTGRNTFTNLADVTDPAANLVGIAQSSSQGAITAQQLEARPIMRSGEVLETVPGVVISQHSGEGKANQYYLRGFNLDHGTDFAATVAGIPVNLPTHGHGHGYSDLNFLIPELVSGVQFSKGPYFAEQGDFATAGSANINYVNTLDKPIVRIAGGGQGFGRALAAASPRVGNGYVLAALEVGHNDGPWNRPDNYRRINGVLRYTTGDAVNGLSFTGMGYRGTWNSTDQVPQRAIAEGLIDRFGTLDRTGGGDTYRYSGSFEWQRSWRNATTKVLAYGLGYDLNLYSNFTYFLDDPDHGDQFHQADHRFVSGAKVSHRRISRFAGREMQNVVGVQLRNDDITQVGLYHTRARAWLDTVRQDDVLQTSVSGYAQNETSWSPKLRTLAGLRFDGYRFGVSAEDPVNGGTEYAGIVSPKGGVVVGPFSGTELYANAGFGFHSNDARGATIRRDPSTGEAVDPVTPLARAKGAEVGVRTVAIPHLQTTLTVWSLSLESELIFVGDAGTTEAGRPSHRYGVEFANYYSPRPWLTLDADLSWSTAHFTDIDPAGDTIPGSIQAVISGGATVDNLRNFFGSLRLRYFGPRPLIEDDSVRSKPTSLLNAEAGYRFSSNIRLSLDLFNLLDASASDIDYYYASRLPGEPAGGVDDIHLHPTLPRTGRVSVIVGF